MTSIYTQKISYEEIRLEKKTHLEATDSLLNRIEDRKADGRTNYHSQRPDK